ncbi:MAG: tRNA 4-thiouridine(8) synthase ThiI [Lachnospiraceae bacterium]|nr:tRNA 4-thiouridine(8) synthase ThiI [Lachnospiraceae bacterium]
METSAFGAFLIKYAEIGIKGKNRYVFEDALMGKIRERLKSAEGDFEVTKSSGRIFVHASGGYDYEETVDALKTVFGICEICPMYEAPVSDIKTIGEAAAEYIRMTFPEPDFSFKVFARRADKSYPLTSMEIASEIGGMLLQKFPSLRVDVHEPEVKLNVELREKVYFYSDGIPGPGGMPVGTNGRAMLLLSGGIDSPVAGYMIAKRGVVIDAVYFHAPPYTSERARQKVEDLAKEIAVYTGPIRLHVVNFTEIQLYIYEKCPHDELTIIMRRYMMRIAEMLAEKNGCFGLITGESLGQVASQTIQSLAVTNEVCRLPVFRPLIGFDKNEIIEISQRIGTYETSILPFEDCCTIFVAKHPVTKPNPGIIRRHEGNLSGKIEELVKEAVETADVVVAE